MEHSMIAAYADMDNMRAHIENARFDLANLRSGVISALTSPNDLFLKVSLVQDIDAIDEHLRKALL